MDDSVLWRRAAYAYLTTCTIFVRFSCIKPSGFPAFRRVCSTYPAIRPKTHDAVTVVVPKKVTSLLHGAIPPFACSANDVRARLLAPLSPTLSASQKRPVPLSRPAPSLSHNDNIVDFTRLCLIHRPRRCRHVYSRNSCRAQARCCRPYLSCGRCFPAVFEHRSR